MSHALVNVLQVKFWVYEELVVLWCHSNLLWNLANIDEWYYSEVYILSILKLNFQYKCSYFSGKKLCFATSDVIQIWYSPYGWSVMKEEWGGWEEGMIGGGWEEGTKEGERMQEGKEMKGKSSIRCVSYIYSFNIYIYDNNKQKIIIIFI